MRAFAVPDSAHLPARLIRRNPFDEGRTEGRSSRENCRSDRLIIGILKKPIGTQLGWSEVDVPQIRRNRGRKLRKRCKESWLMACDRGRKTPKLCGRLLQVPKI